MKNKKKTTIIALMLMLAMVITSEAFVFAADGIDEGSVSPDAQTVEQGTSVEQGEPEVTEPEVTDPEAAETADPEEISEDADVDGEQAEESEEEAEAGPATELTKVDRPVAVEKVTAYPGYKSVTLRWKKVDGVKSYLVMKSTKEDSGFERRKVIDANDAKYIVKVDGVEYMNFRDASGIKKNTNYYYRVYSRKYLTSSQEELLSEEYAAAHDKAVRPIYEKITFKVTKTLTSHDKAHKKHTFKAGETQTAEGFGGGCYKFYYKGHLYYAYFTRIKNAKANLKKDSNYSDVTAENFVNEYGRAKSKKSNYLIWVSTYTQHLYIFKWNKTKKKWKVYKDWECSTGKASTPSPTGFKESTKVKMRSRSGISWWMTYRSTNAIHGKRSSYQIDGSPHSHGCIRNYNSNAKWMYNNIPLGTPLIVN
jgi:hypothetical protein